MARRSILAFLTVIPLAAQTTALEHYQAGSKAFVEQRFDAAIASLSRSLKLEPKQPRVLRLLGLSYQLSNRYDQAESTLQAATKLAPDDGETWFYLGRLFYIRNFFDRALPPLRKAAALLPNDIRVRETLALTLEASGDAAAAQDEYQHALPFATEQNATLFMNYGALLLKRNQPGPSEPMLAKAARLLPKFWQAHFELARLYYQTERWDAALTELNAALECNPAANEAARTHALLSLVYSRLGRDEDARRAATAAEK